MNPRPIGKESVAPRSRVCTNKLEFIYEAYPKSMKERSTIGFKEGVMLEYGAIVNSKDELRIYKF